LAHQLGIHLRLSGPAAGPRAIAAAEQSMSTTFCGSRVVSSRRRVRGCSTGSDAAGGGNASVTATSSAVSVETRNGLSTLIFAVVSSAGTTASPLGVGSAGLGRSDLPSPQRWSHILRCRGPSFLVAGDFLRLVHDGGVSLVLGGLRRGYPPHRGVSFLFGNCGTHTRAMASRNTRALLCLDPSASPRFPLWP
jgi:hypothetical protein